MRPVDRASVLSRGVARARGVARGRRDGRAGRRSPARGEQRLPLQRRVVRCSVLGVRHARPRADAAARGESRSRDKDVFEQQIEMLGASGLSRGVIVTRVCGSAHLKAAYLKPCRWTTYHSPRHEIMLVSSKSCVRPVGSVKRKRERNTR